MGKPPCAVMVLCDFFFFSLFCFLALLALVPAPRGAFFLGAAVRLGFPFWGELANKIEVDVHPLFPFAARPVGFVCFV